MTVSKLSRIPYQLFSVLLAASAPGCTEEVLDCQLTPNIVDLATDASPIHDPAMIKVDNTYYVYSSSDLGSFYRSTDMRHWEFAGEVFSKIPQWLMDEVPVANHIGAPDISFRNDRFLYFYQSHQPNTCNAATGLATNKSLDPAHPHYHWVDHGLVLRSKPFYEGVDVYCGNDDAVFNAIDAHFFDDTDGKSWLVFGSTIGGIKIVELDAESLRPAAGAEFTTLARRFLLQDDPIIEAPYIIHRHGYYYLFMSFNHCCLDEKTRYQVRVGRAEEITGPYYDKDGWPLTLEGGSLVIDGDKPFIGTGHNNIFSEDGVDWLVHHAKNPSENFRAYLNIRQMNWDEQQWPTVCQPNTPQVIAD